MHFKIIVANGHYPLEYRCSTAHEAYGCLEALSTGLLHDTPIDLDEIMRTLVNIKNGFQLSLNCYKYQVLILEEEI